MEAPLVAKLTTVTLGLLVLILASLFWQINNTWHALALRDLDRRGAFLATHEAGEIAPWVQSGDSAALQRYAKEEAVYASPEVASMQIRDGRGNVVMDSATTPPDAHLRTATAPLPGVPGGEVRIFMRDAHVTREVDWMIRRFALTTASFAVLGLLGAWWLTRQVTRPMRDLVKATQAVREGNFGTRAPVRAADEIGKLAQAFNEMAATLEQKDGNRRHLLRQAIVAAEEERRRVARELHDQAGQTLTCLIAGLAALQADPTSRRVADLQALAAEAYTEVHDLSRTLRPAALDEAGLVAAVKEHCRSFASRFGVRVDCEAVGLDDKRLPGELEVAFYRIVQEALTNAVRHGQAAAIQVLLQRQNGNVLAVIEDNGCGFDTHAWQDQNKDGTHLGLLGIRERTNLLGGRFNIESRAGVGTGIFVNIPVEKHHNA